MPKYPKCSKCKTDGEDNFRYDSVENIVHCNCGHGWKSIARYTVFLPRLLILKDDPTPELTAEEQDEIDDIQFKHSITEGDIKKVIAYKHDEPFPDDLEGDVFALVPKIPVEKEKPRTQKVSTITPERFHAGFSRVPEEEDRPFPEPKTFDMVFKRPPEEIKKKYKEKSPKEPENKLVGRFLRVQKEKNKRKWFNPLTWF